jgi:hypothetical protein
MFYSEPTAGVQGIPHIIQNAFHIPSPYKELTSRPLLMIQCHLLLLFCEFLGVSYTGLLGLLVFPRYSSICYKQSSVLIPDVENSTSFQLFEVPFHYF